MNFKFYQPPMWYDFTTVDIVVIDQLEFSVGKDFVCMYVYIYKWIYIIYKILNI